MQCHAEPPLEPTLKKPQMLSSKIISFPEKNNLPNKTMDKYYRHSERTWDLFTSTVHPQILARSGWIEITEKQYRKLQKKNWKENAESGL